MRFVPCLLAFAALATAADVEPKIGPKPMPPGPAQGQGQSIPIQMPPAPRTMSTIRLVAVDAKGPTAEGQKVLDELLADGWRVISLSTVTPHEGGATIAVLASKVAPKDSPKP